MDKLPPVVAEGDYQEFIRQTGFQFERTCRKPPLLSTPTGARIPTGARKPATREIFVAEFDSQRVSAYVRKLSSSVDNYRNREIFNIPRENRVVRVCVLGPDFGRNFQPRRCSCYSRHRRNRFRQAGLSLGGPRLLRRYYQRVPLASLAWGIVRVAPESQKNTPYVLPGGFDLFFPPDTVTVVSVRYLRVRSTLPSAGIHHLRRKRGPCGRPAEFFPGCYSVRSK